MIFLHTADWQIGKPFQGVVDATKRQRLREYRLEAVRALGRLAAQEGAELVLVAGDLFDSATPDQATVVAFCGAVGQIGVPVVAIPGNHDHGGAGCVWRQAFYQREAAKLAPNLRVLLEPTPVVLASVVVFPCPLVRKQGAEDPTAWLRSLPEEMRSVLPTDRPWVVLAHGSVQGFSSAGDQDGEGGVSDTIDLGRLPGDFDYVALGDWHGVKAVSPRAWYAGALEQDRFPKGADYRAGWALRVELPGHGQPPMVQERRVGRVRWHRREFTFSEAAGVSELAAELDRLLERRVDEDALELALRGLLGLDDAVALGEVLESWRARLLELRLDDRTVVEPTEAELASLVQREDPIIAQVALELHALMVSTGPDAAPRAESVGTQSPSGEAALARTALRELFLELAQLGGAAEGR